MNLFIFIILFEKHLYDLEKYKTEYFIRKRIKSLFNGIGLPWDFFVKQWF